MSFQSNIDSGKRFLKNLVSKDNQGWYWEISKEGDAEHKIYPQSQYLLYITFKRLNEYDLAHVIEGANLFQVPAVDREIYANARFCVLDNDGPPFYLAGKKLSDVQSHYDEVALLGHYLAIRGDTGGAQSCATFLQNKWDSKSRLLGMDDADAKAKNGQGLFRIYKTALAGTLFARVGQSTPPNCTALANRLAERGFQDSSGGWITDRTRDDKPDGLPNLETTCLALICLDCAQNRNNGTRYSIPYP
jgi:hypothetical protein